MEWHKPVGDCLAGVHISEPQAAMALVMLHILHPHLISERTTKHLLHMFYTLVSDDRKCFYKCGFITLKMLHVFMLQHAMLELMILGLSCFFFTLHKGYLIHYQDSNYIIT